MTPLIEALDNVYADFAARCGDDLKSVVALTVYGMRDLVNRAIAGEAEVHEVLEMLVQFVNDELNGGRLDGDRPTLH